MHSNTSQFAGPLFLVGMPRSGTKLLRAMLDQHHDIRFTVIETEFFPFWVAKWRQLGATEGQEGFRRFYRECLRSPFFVQYADRGIRIECDEWFHACRSYTPAGVFEALIKSLLSISQQDNRTIWGDKSPSYLRHVPLLIDQFPQARIIHIVRDVRDCCLSANRAWGKSMLRVAQRWQDDVSKCCEDGRNFPSAYTEVRYEDLVSQPEATLMRLSTFVGVDFAPQMLTPSANTENLGDAKGMKTILTSNVRKYESKMSPSTESMIESIACTTLRALGYPCSYSGQPLRLPAWRMRLLQLADGLRLFRRTTAKRGLIRGSQFLIENFRISGNRSH